MPNPLLIVQTRSGFALAELPSDVLAAMEINVADLQCFASLEGATSYTHDGAIDAVKAHFAPRYDALKAFHSVEQAINAEAA